MMYKVLVPERIALRYRNSKNAEKKGGREPADTID